MGAAVGTALDKKEKRQRNELASLSSRVSVHPDSG
jgi:hypothetical protein